MSFLGFVTRIHRPAAYARPGGVVPWRGVVLGALALTFLGGCAAVPPSTPWDPASGTARPSEVEWPVVGRAQRHSLSCESRSACDLLGYLGVEVLEDDFLALLPVSDNPELGFVGSVDDPGGGLPPAGYGVYERPVAAAIRCFGVRARPLRGASLEWLRDELAKGRPVILWATSGLDAPPVELRRDRAGRAFQVVAGEHTFLAVGYRPGVVLLLDPATGTPKAVRDDRLDASWAVLDRRAIAVEP